MRYTACCLRHEPGREAVKDTIQNVNLLYALGIHMHTHFTNNQPHPWHGQQ